jgi:hypothetical protein
MSGPQSGFYDAGAIKQIAINLFYGWGYNFYREENQLRADDLMVRAKVGWLLGAARASVETAESAYRREFLLPPTREKPRPDPAAMAGSQALEALSRAIGALEGQIRAQPVPENDRMMQRYREEAATLQKLIESDQLLVGRADLLRTLLDLKSGTWIAENAGAINEGLWAIGEALRQRQTILIG